MTQLWALNENHYATLGDARWSAEWWQFPAGEPRPAADADFDLDDAECYYATYATRQKAMAGAHMILRHRRKRMPWELVQVCEERFTEIDDMPGYGEWETVGQCEEVELKGGAS